MTKRLIRKYLNLNKLLSLEILNTNYYEKIIIEVRMK